MSARRPHERATLAEAAALSPREHPAEIDEGRWAPVTRNTWRHGCVLVNVAALLRQYAKREGGWSVSGGDPGTKLARDPDVLRGPDVGIVRADRKPTGHGVDGWLDGAPDVAVEIAGDSQSHSELAKKALQYLGAGAKMVWVPDPDAQRVVLYTPPDHVRVLGAADELDGGDVLPGFRCGVAELFE